MGFMPPFAGLFPPTGGRVDLLNRTGESPMTDQQINFAFLRVRAHVSFTGLSPRSFFIGGSGRPASDLPVSIGGPCLRGSWVEKDGQTTSSTARLLGFDSERRSAHTNDAFPASIGGRSCPGLFLFQDCRALSRRSAAATAFLVRRQARFGTLNASRALAVHGFRPRLVPRACKQCRPQRDASAWGLPKLLVSLQRFRRSTPCRFPGGGSRSEVASAQVEGLELPV
jgi:hypothetical protein